MTDPTKYHIKLLTGDEFFNCVNWLESTDKPYSAVRPIQYNPEYEMLVVTESGPACIGLRAIAIREPMESYQKRDAERNGKLLEIQEFEKRTRQEYEDIYGSQHYSRF